MSRTEVQPSPPTVPRSNPTPNHGSMVQGHAHGVFPCPLLWGLALLPTSLMWFQGGEKVALPQALCPGLCGWFEVSRGAFLELSPGSAAQIMLGRHKLGTSDISQVS